MLCIVGACLNSRSSWPRFPTQDQYGFLCTGLGRLVRFSPERFGRNIVLLKIGELEVTALSCLLIVCLPTFPPFGVAWKHAREKGVGTLEIAPVKSRTLSLHIYSYLYSCVSFSFLSLQWFRILDVNNSGYAVHSRRVFKLKK